MSEDAGEKTEQPTARKLEEALSRGQIARSPEVQTVFVLLSGLCALTFAGREIWQQLVSALMLTLGHLHDIPLTADSLQGYGVSGCIVLLRCAGPVVLATMLGGVLAGTMQNRFNLTSEAFTPNWNRLNPMEGFQRIFSTQMLLPTGISAAKLVFIFALSYNEIQSILTDPIFTSAVSTGRLAQFLAETCLRICFRITMLLAGLAAADYGYQFWKTGKDLKMTKEEVKEEAKSSEGNQQVKNARRRRRSVSKAKALAEVPTADVIITNPTRIAIALRYDRKTMRAPKIVAKGIRLNAKIIRELAQRHQVPILENKPLARLLFKHGKVGGEVPAQLFAGVAEVMAWVYRVNRYRYYAEQNLK